MDNKLIIFLVFAGLAQSFVAQSLVVDYGLSEEGKAYLTQIIDNQKATVSAEYDGYNLIFGILEKYLSILIFKIDAVPEDDTSELVVAIERVKYSIDLILDSILLTVQESCSDVVVTRNQTHTDIEDAFAATTAAIKLALSRNYFEDRNELEELEATAEAEIVGVISSVYNLLRNCLPCYGEGATSAVIQMAQAGSEEALVHVVHALFNAIKVYAAAATVGTPDVSLLVALGEYRRYALRGLQANVEYKYSLLRTLFIATQLNQIEIVAPLAANQYALTVSYDRFEEGLLNVFRTIAVSLTSPALGLQDIGPADYSLLDVAQANTVEEFKAAREAFLTSVLALHPDAVAAVADALGRSAVTSEGVVATYYNAIRAGRDRNANIITTLIIIEAFRTSLRSQALGVAAFYFDLNRNGEIWDYNSETEFRNLQNETLYAGKDIVGNVLNAAVIMAEAFNGNNATKADFEAVKIYSDAALYALDRYTQYISAGGVVAIKAANLVIID